MAMKRLAPRRRPGSGAGSRIACAVFAGGNPAFVLPAVIALCPLVTMAATSTADAKAGGITVSSPTAGVTFAVGDTMTISWTIEQDVSALVIDLSVNNGRTYTTIGSFLNGDTPYVAHEWRWRVLDTVVDTRNQPTWTISDSCRIYLHGYFELGTEGGTGVFSIGPLASVRNRRETYAGRRLAPAYVLCHSAALFDAPSDPTIQRYAVNGRTLLLSSRIGATVPPWGILIARLRR